MEKKLIRNVTVFQPDGSYEFFKFGEDNVVAITPTENAIAIFLRLPDEKPDDLTPKKMEDRPKIIFTNLPFIVRDTLQ